MHNWLCVSTSAPSAASVGEHYFNSSTNLIYTCTASGTPATWDDGSAPQSGIVYYDTSNRAFYAWNGSAMLNLCEVAADSAVSSHNSAADAHSALFNTAKSTVALRADSTAYSVGDRVIYPGKAGYTLVCTTAGTSNSSAPAFPASVTSGTTTLADGTAVWTLYDATAPEISTVAGLTAALGGKADTAIPAAAGNLAGLDASGNLADSGLAASAFPIRKDSTAYVPGDRALYPGKAGYVLVCSTAGTSASSAPAFPASVTSGTTTLTDGTVTWTIYDAAQAPGSGSGFGRWDPAGWTSVTKNTTYQASGDGW